MTSHRKFGNAAQVKAHYTITILRNAKSHYLDAHFLVGQVNAAFYAESRLGKSGRSGCKGNT
jgi:hypothetical protein